MRRLALCLGLLLMAACGETGDGITAGTVIGKGHQASYTTYTPVCASYNQKGYCNFYTQIANHHPERWELHLQDCTEADEKIDRYTVARIEACLHDTVEVDIGTWDEVSIGEWYGANPPLGGNR